MWGCQHKRRALDNLCCWWVVNGKTEEHFKNPSHSIAPWYGTLLVLTPLLSLTGVLLFTLLAGLQPKLRTSREWSMQICSALIFLFPLPLKLLEFSVSTLSLLWNLLAKDFLDTLATPSQHLFWYNAFQSLSSGVTLSLFVALLLQPIWTIDFLLLILLHLHLSVFIVSCSCIIHRKWQTRTTHSHCIT